MLFCALKKKISTGSPFCVVLACQTYLRKKLPTFILTKNECNHMRETASKPSMAKYLGKLILFIFKLTYVLERKGVYMWLGNLS